MKKLNVILTLFLSLFAGSAFASSYLTICESDTFRISPSDLHGYAIIPVFGNLDGVSDHWRFQIDHPSLLQIRDVAPQNYLTEDNYDEYDLTVHYTQSDGTAAIHYAELMKIVEELTISTDTKRSIYESSITEQGFWDSNNDGVYEAYGTVKWGPGHINRMFDIHFYVNGDCTGDSIVLKTTFTSSTDWRYPAVNVVYNQVIRIVVAYLLGDVNGDEIVNIHDVTALMDYLLDPTAYNLNQYQFDAMDVNRSGTITIADVTALLEINSMDN